MPGLLIHGARQVLTLRGANSPRRGAALRNLSIIEDASILIEDGKIRDVGPTRRIENLAAARSAHQLCARGRVVMPGFVDSHVQLVGGLNSRLIRQTPAWRLAEDAAALLRRCLRYGTTTLEVKSCRGLDETSALKVLRMIADLSKAQPIEVISTYCGELSCMGQLIGEKRLAQFVAIASSEAAGFLVKTQAEVAITDPWMQATTVEHLERISRPQIDRLAESAAVAVLMPGFGFHCEGRGDAPARELIAQGVAVALASGYDRSVNPSFSMPITIELACRKLGMAPSEAIVAATLNGAHAVGRGAATGSLEPGKNADILILETADYRDLAYETGVNPVDITIVRGEIVCQNSVSYGAVAG